MIDNPQASLRQTLRAARNNLTAKEQTLAARRLASRVSQSRYFRSSKRVACYFAADGEIGTDAIIERIWRTGRTCYIPILTHMNGERLWFAPVTRQSRYVINRYGIPEPAVASRMLLDARNLDLILVPLVGFDALGNRIGMGGGFYDRTLSFLRHRSHWFHPRIVGLAHALQQTEAINPNPWDIPLDAVATDRRLITFEHRRN